MRRVIAEKSVRKLFWVAQSGRIGVGISLLSYAGRSMWG